MCDNLIMSFFIFRYPKIYSKYNFKNYTKQTSENYVYIDDMVYMPYHKGEIK